MISVAEEVYALATTTRAVATAAPAFTAVQVAGEVDSVVDLAVTVVVQVIAHLNEAPRSDQGGTGELLLTAGPHSLGAQSVHAGVARSTQTGDVVHEAIAIVVLSWVGAGFLL